MNRNILKPIAIAAMLCASAFQAQAASPNNGGLRGMQGLRAHQFSDNQLGVGAQLAARRAERGGLRLNAALGQTRLGVSLERARNNRLNGAGATLPGLMAAGRQANPENNTSTIERMRAAQSERQSERDSNDNSDDNDNDNDNDNGFLGIENSSTLGMDDRDSQGNDDGDSGFLGIGNSSTLGTDDGPSGPDNDDNGFLGINNSSTLGTDDNNGKPGDSNDSGFLGFGDSSTLGTD
ncbi:MAG: hypothetical protein ACT4PZ_00845 [Panacagrimonas sp.]